MKIITPLVAIVTVSLSLIGCLEIVGNVIEGAQIEAETKQWVGSSKDQLLQACGYPTFTSPGDDSEIWTYNIPRWLEAYTDTDNIYHPPRQYMAVREFWINSAGIVYAYWWQEETRHGSINRRSPGPDKQ